MSKSRLTPAEELKELRRQIVALTARVADLEAAAGDAAPAVADPAPAAPGDEIPWLVIAAAVATVVKGPHRIMNLQLSGLPPLNLWSIEGRRAVFHSHRVR